MDLPLEKYGFAKKKFDFATTKIISFEKTVCFVWHDWISVDTTEFHTISCNSYNFLQFATYIYN